jgi:hypothetical protein
MLPATLVAALLASASCVALAGQPVRFGQAEITIPEGYAHALEDGGRTLLMRPTQEPKFDYRLTFHRLVQPVSPQTPEEIVAALARKKRMQPYEIRGSSHVGFLDMGTRSTVDGEPVRRMEGAVALKEGYATMTVAVPEKYANHLAVRDFLGVGVEHLLATLRYVGE